MTKTVDYYIAPQSPFVYLGHERFMKILAETGARARLMPVDLGGKIFPASGGLPLPKRAPQRQAYRLLELRRFSAWLGLPMHIEPKFFPVAGDDAARLLIAVDRSDGIEAALKLLGAIARAVWAEQCNIADPAVLGELLHAQGLPPERLAALKDPQMQQAYEDFTRQALDAGVFGAPSFVIDGELFWGQDRLDFVARKLAAG
ncbi:MAG: 2-hydroxychromene-2-carboxylate isomerase [Ideonella sp.]